MDLYSKKRGFKRAGASGILALATVILGSVSVSTPAGFGQATAINGSIQGTITDPSGAVVPNAAVTITSSDTGAQRTFQSNNAGFYASGPLIPGNYTVKVSAPGFSDTEVKTIVQINVATSGNVKLHVGSSGTTVQVDAGAIQVQDTQSNVQDVITQQQIQTLPINGRNFLDLAQLEPGVQLQSGGDFDPTKAGYSGLSFSGTSGRTTRILLDGQDITDENVGTTIFNVSQGAIGQFQVVRSTADVSNDLGSTGQVMVSTNSGTNQYHGQLFYNFQDQDAGFASNQGIVSPFQRNQFGGSIGGPIIKDRLFFFGNAERIKQDSSTASQFLGPFAGLQSLYPNIPSPFRDTYSTARLDWNGPWGVHFFARANYEVNSAVTNGGEGFWNYANRDNTPGIAGGADFVQGHTTHSIRVSYEKFHNLISDTSSSSGFDLVPGVSIYLVAAGLYSGPNANAPQQTYQSDKQVRYDGSTTFGAHNLRFGASMNRLLGGGYASFFGTGPRARLTLNTLVSGDASNPLNYHPNRVQIGNGLGYYTETPEFGAPAGGQGDWRVGAYIADSWKVTPNFTLNYGLRYQRDTGRTDSDLAPIPCSQIDPALGYTGCSGNTPILDQFGQGLGARVTQPNYSFGPQLGFAYALDSGKTVIRGGVGRFFENSVFNNVLFDRPAKLPTGLFNNYVSVCGGTGTINIPGMGTVSTSPDGTSIKQLCAEPIGQSAAQFLALENEFKAGSAKAGPAANPGYLGKTLSMGPGGFTAFSPNYKTPYATQVNLGVQQELFPGAVLSVDYVHSVTIHIGQVIDVNHVGDARYFDKTAAQSAVAYTLTTCKVGTVDEAIVSCPGLYPDGGGVNISDFAGNGLDTGVNYNGGGYSQLAAAGSAYAHGGPRGSAFPGKNPLLGQGLFQFPAGRSGYDALQFNFRQQKAHPMPFIADSNLEVSYAYSKFVSNIAANATANNSDTFFNGQAYDYNNPTQYVGFGGLDHRHNLSFGGSATISHGPQISLIGHIISAAPTNLTLDNTQNNPGQIFQTDWTGDGTTGDLIQGTNPGAYMRSIKGSKLNRIINQYNGRFAGTTTPAGQVLLDNGIFSPAQLTSLQGVQQQIQAAPAKPYNNPMFRQIDASVLYPIRLPHLGESTRLLPGAAVYNVANFGNYGNITGNLINVNNDATTYVNGPSDFSIKNSLRTIRQSGTFAAGTPRAVEFQLKLEF